MAAWGVRGGACAEALTLAGLRALPARWLQRGAPGGAGGESGLRGLGRGCVWAAGVVRARVPRSTEYRGMGGDS